MWRFSGAWERFRWRFSGGSSRPSPLAAHRRRLPCSRCRQTRPSAGRCQREEVRRLPLAVYGLPSPFVVCRLRFSSFVYSAELNKPKDKTTRVTCSDRSLASWFSVAVHGKKPLAGLGDEGAGSPEHFGEPDAFAEAEKKSSSRCARTLMLPDLSGHKRQRRAMGSVVQIENAQADWRGARDRRSACRDSLQVCHAIGPRSTGEYLRCKNGRTGSQEVARNVIHVDLAR